MQAFKSLTTNQYIQGVRQHGWPPFEKQVWLRNYWERIVRDEREWRAAHEYIEQNPARWMDDKHHPSNASSNEVG
jgi:REP element-mobilizing transposase RayT